MASMMDRGDSYHVIYLGSCMLSHMSTGLGVLQKPLRDLYFKYRQSGGGPAAQERYLRMSARGMTMTYKESASAAPTEVFYSMPSILFWDAVQFCTVRGPDRKLRGAFEPVDNDQSRNKDNLFSVLEKKYHFLQQMTHPPLFTCVLRRTQGVKALDVHAFVCSGDQEALGLVRSLHLVHHHYNKDETVETGVFGYRPFAPGTGPTVGTPSTETAGPPGTGSGGSSSSGGGGGVGGGAGPDVAGGGRSPDGVSGRPYSRQQPSLGAGRYREQQAAPPPPPPARPTSVGRRAGGRVQVLPTDPHSQSRLSSHGLSSSLSSLSAHDRPRVYQLTQEDFRPRHADDADIGGGGSSSGGGGSNERRRRFILEDGADVKRRGSAPQEDDDRDHSPDSDDGQHVYQYIRHIETSPVSTAERRPRGLSTPTSPTSPVVDPVRNLREGINGGSGGGVRGRLASSTSDGSIERDKVARSRALVENALASQHNSFGRHLGNRPLPVDPPSSASPSSRPVSRVSIFGSPVVQAPPPPRDDRKLGQVHHSGGLQPADGGRGSARSGGGGGLYMDGDDRGSVDHESFRSAAAAAAAAAAERGIARGLSQSREDVRPPSSASGGYSSAHSSPFADRGSRGSPFAPRDSPTRPPPAKGGTPDPPSRPVAMVPPHKVTGVKVFPAGQAVVGSLRSTGAKITGSIDENDRPKNLFGNGKPTAEERRAKSKYFDDPQYMDESSSSDSSPAKSPPPGSNWAFGRTGHDDSGTGSTGSDRGRTGGSSGGAGDDGTLNEKLLLSKKKDAEIASVLQNLQFEHYDTSTVSPGMPAGNNFEKSLGYFP